MIYIWRVSAFHFFNSLSFSAIQGHQITYQVQSRTSVMVSRRAKTVQGLSFGHLSHSVFAELYNNKYISTRAFIWNIISWKLAFLLFNATLFTSGLKRRKNYYRENQIWMILFLGSFDKFPGRWWYCFSNEVVGKFTVIVKKINRICNRRIAHKRLFIVLKYILKIFYKSVEKT